MCSEGYFSLVSLVLPLKRLKLAYLIDIFILGNFSSFFILEILKILEQTNSKILLFFICFRQLRDFQIQVKYRKNNVFLG